MLGSLRWRQARAVLSGQARQRRMERNQSAEGFDDSDRAGYDSEAMRNAEHYLYSHSRVSNNSSALGAMLVNPVGYS
jgi:hypothetical protein